MNRDPKVTNGAQALLFAPGQFYGCARLSFSSHGISVSHRIADQAPEDVLSHTHADAHFVLVTGGDYVSAAAGVSAIGSPVLVYNPPGTVHRDHFERGRGSFFAISLEPAIATAASTETQLPNVPVYLTEPAQYAIALRIASSCTSHAAGLTLDALCHELLGSMDRQAERETRTAPAWLHHAMELLHDRYLEDLTIADVAAGVGVHPVHLARSFRHHFGCTPGEFARFRRLEKAADLLVRSGLPLADVALNCGFADQSHLSKAFSRSLGLPPGEYRALAGFRGTGPQMFQFDKSGRSRWDKIRTWTAAARESPRRRK
jgi:AraC family transcriptional regulator